MRRIVLYSAVVLFLLLLARWRVGRMFYYPDRTVYGTPASHGLKYEQIRFRSRDGTVLSGWFIPAVGRAKGTVIHFHGNAQNMTSHFGFVSWLPASGFNLFMFDYRGYGLSEGRPDKRGLYLDSCAALDYVRSRGDLDKKRLLLFGQSLGGAQAMSAMAGSDRRGIRAVVAEASFFSYRAIVRDAIATMPLVSRLATPLSYLLIGDEYSPSACVAEIAPVPLLLIHGTADRIIPWEHSRLLLERAGEPKQFWRLEGIDHTEAFVDPDSPHRRRLVEFLEAAVQ